MRKTGKKGTREKERTRKKEVEEKSKFWGKPARANQRDGFTAARRAPVKIPTFTNLHQRTHTGIDNTENGANVVNI